MKQTVKDRLKNFLTPRRQRVAGRILFGAGLCLFCATQVYAQTDPFSTTATSWETMLTGTFAQMVTVSGIVIAGVPLVTGQAGDHKKGLISAAVGGTIILAAQRVVSTLIGQ